MRLPARILRSRGLITYTELSVDTGQSVQYVSMQLNGKRRLTDRLRIALYANLDERIADDVIASIGEA